MNRSRLKWAVALGASVVVHAGAAAVFIAPVEEVQIAGGQQSGVIVLGDAFEDMASAGEPVDPVQAVQPEATPAEVVEAIQPEPAPAAPAETVQAEAVTAQAQSVALEQAAIAAIEPTAVAPVAPAETSRDITATVPLDPSAAAAVEAEPLKPVETEETVAALAPIPVPTPRPDYTPPAPKKAEPRQAAKQPTQTGSRGQNQRDARRGASDGGASAAEGASTRSERTASTAGNAAVSNYPGKIVSELRRALRYPSEARRDRITGEAHVRFTVNADGAAVSVKIVRSSGSPILDQAALETVRRAAPFPAIPRAAGRSSWPFTVPLAFSR